MSFRSYLLENSGGDLTSEIIKAIKKMPGIRKYIGKNSIYFDHDDLVFADKTVFDDVLGDSGNSAPQRPVQS